MTAEKQQLLKEIVYLSNLINAHKKQWPTTKVNQATNKKIDRRNAAAQTDDQRGKSKDVAVAVTSSTSKPNCVRVKSVAGISISPIQKKKEEGRNRSSEITKKVDGMKASRFKWMAKHKVEDNKANKKESKSIYSILKITTPRMKKSTGGDTIATKYKLIRKTTMMPSKRIFKGLYKIVNSKSPRHVSPKRIRRVGIYSIKYETKENKTNKKAMEAMKLMLAKQAKRKLLKLTSLTNDCRQRKVLHLSAMEKPGDGRFVSIGGIVYKSTRNKLSRTDRKTNRNAANKSAPKSSRMITVRGTKFLMDPFGKTLKRMNIENSKNAKGETINLSRIDFGGRTFLQSQPGVLVLSQSTKWTFASRSVNRSINRLVAMKKKSSQFCLFFNRFGKCAKHESGKCPYIHDPNKVAICTRFLQQKCTDKNCRFSHTVSLDKMPVCTFFLKGRCNADSCPYRHVNVNPEADVCQDFVNGFCPQQEKCKKLHVFCCPEFKRTGKCTKTKCMLKHHVRIRKQREKLKELELDNPIAKDSSSNKEAKEDSSKLPSFIKLADESLSEDVESCTPLRIRPLFLS